VRLQVGVACGLAQGDGSLENGSAALRGRPPRFACSNMTGGLPPEIDGAAASLRPATHLSTPTCLPPAPGQPQILQVTYKKKSSQAVKKGVGNEKLKD